MPCEFDMFRDEKTREPEVLPVRWSLVETVIRMVLHEPDEVCARMDDLVERFLRLAPLEKYEDAYETLMVRLIGPACRLGKLSFLESLLCHAHLEEWPGRGLRPRLWRKRHRDRADRHRKKQADHPGGRERGLHDRIAKRHPDSAPSPR